MYAGFRSLHLSGGSRIDGLIERRINKFTKRATNWLLLAGDRPRTWQISCLRGVPFCAVGEQPPDHPLIVCCLTVYDRDRQLNFSQTETNRDSRRDSTSRQECVCARLLIGLCPQVPALGRKSVPHSRALMAGVLSMGADKVRSKLDVTLTVPNQKLDQRGESVPLKC